MNRSPVNRLTLALIAPVLAAALLIPLAPADAGDRHPAYDPCAYYHHSDNEDFLAWEMFCDDTVRDLHHRHFTTQATCGYIIDRYTDSILHFCDRHCARCFDSDEGCRFPRMKVGSKSRAARYKIGKCTWDAQMDYDAIYQGARQQLEDAGYDCLVAKLYTTYQYVKTTSVRDQRASNNCISYAVASCHCREIGPPPADCGSPPSPPPPGGGGDPPGDQDGDGGDGGDGRP